MSQTRDFIGALEIGDAALERAAMASPVPTNPPIYCPRIDDGALEVAAERVLLGPSSRPGLPGCLPMADDGALEGAVGTHRNPTRGFGQPCL